MATGFLPRRTKQGLLVAASRVYQELGFTDQTDAATGIKMLVPTNLLTQHRAASFGTHWQSGDDSIELETLAIPETQTSFPRLLRRLSEAGGRKIEYKYVTNNLFVLSGEVGDRKFYTAVVRSGTLSQGISVSWTPAEDKIGRIVSAFLASVIKFPVAGDVGEPNAVPQASPPSISTGSGFSISADGVIVTNAHVVDGCGSIEVKGFGAAKPITLDSGRDLAVIGLDKPQSIGEAKIQTAALHLGEAVVALGYPLSDVMGNALTINPGVVSSLSGLGGDSATFTVSANVQPGNSGGPILNMRGEVVGVAQAKLDEVALLKAEGTTGGSIGFAIGATTLVDFLRPFKFNSVSGRSGDEISAEEVAGLARQFTVQVVCTHLVKGFFVDELPASALGQLVEPVAILARKRSQLTHVIACHLFLRVRSVGRWAMSTRRTRQRHKPRASSQQGRCLVNASWQLSRTIPCRGR